MSLNKIRQVRRGKAFAVRDVLIYGVILAAVVAVFLAVFLTRDKSPLQGIRISVEGEIVYEYSFLSGEEVVFDSRFVQKSDGQGDTFTLKITSPYGYNTVEINRGGSVKVTEADCGKLDCVYSGELKNNGGVIYCSPHKLKIEPTDYDIDGGNIIM